MWPQGQLGPREGERVEGPRLPADHDLPAETQPLLEVLPPPAEDACSCQFPEEERGERLGKDELGAPWV